MNWMMNLMIRCGSPNLNCCEFWTPLRPRRQATPPTLPWARRRRRIEAMNPIWMRRTPDAPWRFRNLRRRPHWATRRHRATPTRTTLTTKTRRWWRRWCRISRKPRRNEAEEVADAPDAAVEAVVGDRRRRRRSICWINSNSIPIQFQFNFNLNPV